MRRPRRTSLDPSWFKAGPIGAQTAHTDEYFVGEEKPSVLAVVMQRLVDRLPERQRDAIEAVSIGGYSYRQAAELLDTYPKAVWRWEKRGIEQILRWLKGSPWMLEMLATHLPFDMVEPDGGLTPAALEDVLTRRLADIEASQPDTEDIEA